MSLGIGRVPEVASVENDMSFDGISRMGCRSHEVAYTLLMN